METEKNNPMDKRNFQAEEYPYEKYNKLKKEYDALKILCDNSLVKALKAENERDKFIEALKDMVSCLLKMRRMHLERVRSYRGQALPHWATELINKALKNNEND